MGQKGDDEMPCTRLRLLETGTSILAFLNNKLDTSRTRDLPCGGRCWFCSQSNRSLQSAATGIVPPKFFSKRAQDDGVKACRGFFSVVT